MPHRWRVYVAQGRRRLRISAWRERRAGVVPRVTVTVGRPLTVWSFLHDNAMQVAGLVQLLVGILLAFTHLTAAQTAALATLPTGVGTFLLGLAITTKKTNAAKGAP